MFTATTHTVLPPPPVGSRPFAAPPPAPRPADPAAAAVRTRSSAAAWVAASGAVLLLAAAATFLAVSWAALGLPARIGVVAALTGAALLGGHALRRSLPVVGTVVFHLGALLLPVDVLGLALQLEVPVAQTWTLVGATAVVALPPLAWLGRSRTLLWGAVAGSAVLATGIGALTGAGAGPLAALGAAPVLTGLVAVGLALVVPAAPGKDAGDAMGISEQAADTPHAAVRGALVWAAPVLVVAALVVAVVATGAARLLDIPEGIVVDAGWALTAASAPLAAAVLSLAALGVIGLTVHRQQRDAPAVAAAPVILLGALLAISPVGTGRTVALVVPAAAFLLVELVTVAFGRRMGTMADLGTGIAEVVAATLVTPPALVAVVAGNALFPAGGDAAVAAVFATVALGWALAAARRVLDGGLRSSLPVALTAAAGIHAVAGLAASMVPGIVTAPLLAAVAVGLALWPWSNVMSRAATHPAPGSRFPGAAAAATWAVPGMAMLATGAALGSEGVALTMVGVAAAHGLLARSLVTIHRGGDIAAALVRTVGATLVVAGLVSVPGAGTSWLPALGAAAAALLLLAAMSEDVPVAADALRAVVGIGVPLATLGAGVLPVTGPVLAQLLGITAVAWWVALGAMGWLGADLARLSRPRIAVLAVPVTVQALGAGALAVGLSPAGAGLVLISAALVGATAAVLAPARFSPAAAWLAGLAGLTGVALLGPRPVLRAVVTMAVGATVAGLSALRRRVWVANLGGVVAVVGSWQLAAALQVQAIDVWLAPLALYLLLAATPVRAQGASSWLTDVPPVLLVGIPAIAERLAGGPGGHAVLAGAVAVGAVAVGGMSRRGGPLVVGTVLLGLVVVVELLLVVVGVPTWVWLALGGAALLGVAAVIERSDGHPVQRVRSGLTRFRERWT